MSERRDELASRLSTVRRELREAAVDVGRSPEEITLIVVTKNFPVSDAVILYELGERNFGENRDNEGSEKSAAIPPDLHWHFQGQVQSKKIKSIAGWAEVVHSLDSLDHAEKFNKFDPRDFFIQVSTEPGALHRGGVPLASVRDFYSELQRFENLRIRGLMVVPPLESNPGEVFSQVAAEARELGLADLSMGMSGDFREAIRAGATHIRVGSSILGSRQPPA